MSSTTHSVLTFASTNDGLLGSVSYSSDSRCQSGSSSISYFPPFSSLAPIALTLFQFLSSDQLCLTLDWAQNLSTFQNQCHLDEVSDRGVADFFLWIWYFEVPKSRMTLWSRHQTFLQLSSSTFHCSCWPHSLSANSSASSCQRKSL